MRPWGEPQTPGQREVITISKETTTTTPKQDKAIACLLACGTLGEAAKAADVSPRSIYKWLREDPAFIEAYRENRSVMLQLVANETAATAAAAVSTLKEIMNDEEERAGARITAARVLLDAYFKLTELSDFEQRLSAIEEKLAAK